MAKWIAGILGTVISGVLVWWLTEGLRTRELPAPSTVAPAPAKVPRTTPRGEGEYAIDIPGKGLVPISEFDKIVINLPRDEDPQRHHDALLLEALNGGVVYKLYKEYDDEGTFSLWLTTRGVRNGQQCFSYITIYDRWAGEKEVAHRLACRTGSEWAVEFSPEFRQLAEDFEKRREKNSRN